LFKKTTLFSYEYQLVKIASSLENKLLYLASYTEAKEVLVYVGNLRAQDAVPGKI
jgi:hypothetical protein